MYLPFYAGPTGKPRNKPEGFIFLNRTAARALPRSRQKAIQKDHLRTVSSPAGDLDPDFASGRKFIDLKLETEGMRNLLAVEAEDAVARLKLLPIEKSSDPGYDYSWYCR